MEKDQIINLKSILERPTYISCGVDGISLVDISKLTNIVYSSPNIKLEMAFYEPECVHEDWFSFYVIQNEVEGRYFLGEVGEPQNMTECTRYFQLNDSQYIVEEANLLPALRKNPDDLQSRRLLAIIRTLMKQKGLENLEEFSHRIAP